MTKQPTQRGSIRNPVAKHGVRFNRPATHLDRKKEAKRGKQRHRMRLLDK